MALPIWGSPSSNNSYTRHAAEEPVAVSVVQSKQAPTSSISRVDQETRTEERHDGKPSPEVTTRFNEAVYSFNVKIAVDRLTQAAICGAGIAFGWPYVLTHGSLVLVAGSLAFTAYRVVQEYRYMRVRAAEVRALETPPELESFKARVDRIVKELCQDMGLKIPDIKIMAGEDVSIAMHERIFSRSTVVLSGHFAQLDDRQLKAVLAHELSHCGRTHSKLDRITSQMETLARPAIFCACWVGLYGLAEQIVGGMLGNLTSLVVAGTVWGHAYYALREREYRISRNNELKTDLRAVRVTRDPEGLIEGIAALLKRAPDADRSMHESGQFLHPSLEERAKNLRSVFCG